MCEISETVSASLAWVNKSSMRSEFNVYLLFETSTAKGFEHANNKMHIMNELTIFKNVYIKIKLCSKIINLKSLKETIFVLFNQ